MSAIEAFSWPFLGALLLVKKPRLFKHVLKTVLANALLAICVLLALLLFTYPLQRSIVKAWLGKGIWVDVTTLLLVCLEAFLPVYMYYHGALVKLQSQLFQAVLKVRCGVRV